MIDWDAVVVSPCVSVFGEPATFMPLAGGSFPVTVVFDNAYREVTTSEFGTEIMSVYPAAGIALSGFPSVPVQGDKITITSNGNTYAVRKPKPDSHGGMHLILSLWTSDER
jgi:hypothetical protein